MTKKILKATHIGTLKIGEIDISCAVLEDGTRVLVERSVANALGKKGSSQYWKKKRSGESALLPEYVSAKYLKPFITPELKTKFSKHIPYIYRKQQRIGIEATVLPDVCHLWIKARDEGALKDKQKIIAQNAYILLKGFAHIGITALVDEATGYQYERDQEELQRILEKYIRKEFLPWTKRFPDDFYRELFRLRGWNYSPLTVKRPQVVGKITNKIVYEQLPQGVLEELKRKTPKSQAGYRTKRFHQSLTLDIGNPHLEKHLASIITLMRISPNWRTFERHFNRAFGKQPEFDFIDELEEDKD